MLTKSPRMVGVTILPIGLFGTKQEWKPSYEQWLCSRVGFVDKIKSVKDESRYNGPPDKREFERIWAEL
jgi:hypothetical protein